jgi:FixJ family two-component response regulator
VNPRIYIVDDDQAVRQSLRALLEVYGFEVQDFPSGESFLDRFEEDGKSCLVLDVHMPGLGGLDVISHLRQVARSTIPVILMTGRGDRDLCAQGIAAGATSYMEKPVDIDQLLAVVDSFRTPTTGAR